MIKKIFIFVIVLFIILAAWARHAQLENRKAVIEQKQNVKAPQESITLLEGWTNLDIGDYLEKNGVTTSKDFLLAIKNFDPEDYPLLTSKPKTANLEGFVFPDTYFIPANPTSTSSINSIILTKALDNFTQKFTPDMESKAKADNMSVFQIITLASIIEKETGKNSVSAGQKQALDNDRKKVASVFYNRLKINMALQSDATVNYVTGKNTPALTIEDTQINSPYNTYKNPGLPPGPICNPSLSSIMAALYPAKTDYMYFLSDTTTGEIVFATTYEEHLKNKQKYLH